MRRFETSVEKNLKLVEFLWPDRRRALHHRRTSRTDTSDVLLYLANGCL